MINWIEKIAKSLILSSLVGLFIFLAFSIEPVDSAVGVSATVSSTMISCTTPMDNATSSFGTIDNTVVYSATTSSTTVSSSGAVFMKGQGTPHPDNPGLYSTTTVALIESPNAAFSATATLAANTEGYGITASTTGTMGIDVRYNWATGTVSYVVGGLATTTAATVASSSSSVSDQVIFVDYRAAVNVTTPGATDYWDTVTFSCTTS